MPNFTSQICPSGSFCDTVEPFSIGMGNFFSAITGNMVYLMLGLLATAVFLSFFVAVILFIRGITKTQ